MYLLLKTGKLSTKNKVQFCCRSRRWSFNPYIPYYSHFFCIADLHCQTDDITGLNVYYLDENIGIICNALDVRGNVVCCTISKRWLSLRYYEIISHGLIACKERHVVTACCIYHCIIRLLAKSNFNHQSC